MIYEIRTGRNIMYNIMLFLVNSFFFLTFLGLLIAVAFLIFIIAWMLEQCFGVPFEHFAELTGVYGIAMGSYVGKKLSEKGK